jgi:hypothetical protein
VDGGQDKISGHPTGGARVAWGGSDPDPEVYKQSSAADNNNASAIEADRDHDAVPANHDDVSITAAAASGCIAFLTQPPMIWASLEPHWVSSCLRVQLSQHQLSKQTVVGQRRPSGDRTNTRPSIVQTHRLWTTTLLIPGMILLSIHRHPCTRYMMMVTMVMMAR